MERNEWFDFFGPHPVVMVSSWGDNGVYVAPFNWVIPLSKNGIFGILMREDSRTLQNINKMPNISLSWMPDDPDTAQKILLTRKSKNQIFFSRSQMDDNFVFPAVPSIALAYMFATFQENRRAHNLLDAATHKLIVCKERGFYQLSEQPPLMFSKYRSFFRAEEFKVEGY